MSADVKVPICPPCQERRMAWLDSRPSKVLPVFGIAHGSGANYDITAEGIKDRSRSRHEQWRLLVREQMAGIADYCRRAGHTAVPTVPVVVQLDLLEQLERAA
jgi:hypothetical protein